MDELLTNVNSALGLHMLVLSIHRLHFASASHASPKRVLIYRITPCKEKTSDRSSQATPQDNLALSFLRQHKAAEELNTMLGNRSLPPLLLHFHNHQPPAPLNFQHRILYKPAP